MSIGLPAPRAELTLTLQCPCTGDVDAGVWSASPVMGLIDKVVSCEELLKTMEKDAEEILLAGAKMVVRESKL